MVQFYYGILVDIQKFNKTFQLTFQDPDTAQVATIPSEVVTEVASRRDRASSVADSSLADTLALLLWLTQNLVADDLQLLATQVINCH